MSNRSLLTGVAYHGNRMPSHVRADMEEIARAANMSRSHLSTHFKAVTGMSPDSYLLNRRVERAVSLLHESDAYILTIAQESGFGNLANFNKTFKRITGMTPRDFRAGKCHL